MVDYVGLAQEEANAYGVPPQLFTDLIRQESGFNPYAISTAGAIGIAQIMPSTASNPGFGLTPVNPWDARASLQFGAQYLRAMFDKFGNWSQALLAYNKGPDYATNNPGEMPYPDSPSILSDVRNASGTSGAGAGNPAGNGPAAYNTTNGPNNSGCSGWLTTPLACGTDLIGRAGFVLLGLVVIAAGLWLLSK